MLSRGLNQDSRYDIYSLLMMQKQPDCFSNSQSNNDNFLHLSEHSFIKFEQSHIDDLFYESLSIDNELRSELAQFNVESIGQCFYLLFIQLIFNCSLKIVLNW